MINSDRIPFTDGNIARSPDRPGVYAFWRGNELTYYGSATVSIRDRLTSHKAGYDGPCTQHSTHYQREVCSNPRERERQLLHEHVRKHGRLPRCNEVMPS